MVLGLSPQLHSAWYRAQCVTAWCSPRNKCSFNQSKAPLGSAPLALLTQNPAAVLFTCSPVSRGLLQLPSALMCEALIAMSVSGGEGWPWNPS